MKKYFGAILIFFSIVTFGVILFSHLDTLVIRKWDEARNVMSALEMKFTEFSIVPTSFYNPDHWNTKPPLLIWIQSLFITLFGRNEIAVRLPTVLAAFALIPFIMGFRKQLKIKLLHAFLFLMIFISFPLVTEIHCYRTGDYDGLLTTFMFFYSIFYYMYLKSDKTKYFYWFTVFLILAFLTKGIASMLFLPGLFIFTLINKQVIPILKKPSFYIGISSLLIIIFGYYFGRESIDPGYIAAVIKNELGGRFLEVTENHSQPFFYYFKHIFDSGAGLWIILFPVALYYTIKRKKNSLAVFSFILAFSHLIVISISQTKLYWYYLPEVPFYSLILAGTVYYILKERENKILIIFLLTLFPLIKQINKVSRVHNLAIERSDFLLSEFIRDNKDYLSDFQNVKILDIEYYEQTRFYIEKNPDYKNFNFRFLKNIHPKDTILYNKDLYHNQIKSKFNETVIYDYNDVVISRVDSEK